ncbi:hypothetical protein KEM52_006637 [Ascosphaera acerosa]|nr:hypothetical protein KEM52_006637 [Ascosphaera acerosa]
MLIIACSRCIIGGKVTPATITISRETGKVAAVAHSVLPREDFAPDDEYRNYDPYVVMPGLVDAHVHLNEPGRSEWEGFYTGTQAAAFGGVTTVIDMPLNAIPPTTTVAGLREKIKAAEGQCWVDVGFYGGLVTGNTGELRPLVKAGVRGFKGFLIHSGVDADINVDANQVDEFPAVTAADIHAAMAELADEKTTLMFHAEMEPDHCPEEDASASPSAYTTFLNGRPATYETRAVEEILAQAHVAPQLPLHIVHLSAMEVIPLLRAARQRGVNITAETCFHYLSLAAEEVADGDTRHKCCPPIRNQTNQDGLWRELERFAQDDGVIRTVVSDHSPCTPDLKLLPRSIVSGLRDDVAADASADIGSFLKAWGGVSSVGLGLPILWTEMQRRRGKQTEDERLLMIAALCSTNTAAQVRLSGRKGDLTVGHDADICVFDPSAEWSLTQSRLLFRNKCSPYEGRRLQGQVVETMLRGRSVYRKVEGEEVQAGFTSEPTGVLLL